MPHARRSNNGLKRKLVVSAILSLAVLGIAVFILTRRPGEAPHGEGVRLQGKGNGAAQTPAESAEMISRPAGPDGSPDAKAPAEAAPETASLELPPPLLQGRVTGEGAGIAGADVNLFSTKTIEQIIERIEDLAPQGGEMPDIGGIVSALREELNRFRASAVNVKSVEDGSYAFRAIEPGNYLVLTLADGWLFRYGDVVSLDAARSETLDIALERGRSISGSVVTAAGQGISGALVAAELRPAGMAGLGLVIRRLLRYVNGEFLKGPFETRTAADGTFTLASLPPGVYDLAASQVPGVEARLQGVETGASEAVIYLGEPALLTGAFSDADGAAAPGVGFLVERLDDVVQLQIPIGGMDKIANSINRLISDGPRKGVSGTRGDFHLGPLSPGRYRLVVEGRGFMPFERAFELDWGQALDLGLLRLDRGAAITGFVRAAGGGIVEGARVLATPAKPNPMNMGGLVNDILTGRISTSVDASGEFRLAGLVRGKYKLVATATGRAPAVLRGVQTDSDPVSLDLKPGTRITGRVMAAEDSRPMADARVRAGESRTKADAEGRFTLDGVAPGNDSFNPFEDMRPPRAGGEDPAAKTTVKVKASADGFITTEANIDLAAGQTEVEITLERAPEIGGSVLDPDGKPAPGSLVRLTPVMPEALPFDFLDSGMIFVAATVTDLEGKFRFSSVKGAEAESRYRVIADHVLYSRGASEGFDLRSRMGKRPSREEGGDGSDDITVTLVRGGEVKGTVTDGAKPVPGATVRLQKAQKKGQQDPFGMFLNMLGLPKGGDAAYTDSDGRFEYTRLAPGDYVVNAEVAGFTDSAAQPLTVAPGGEVEVTLTVDPGGVIPGAVSDASGTALAGARVRLFREPAGSEAGGERNEERQMLEVQKLFGGAYKSARTAEDGSFLFQGLPAGTYAMSAEHPGYVKREVGGLSPGGDGQRIVLERAAALAGVVVDSGSGMPIARFRVRITRGDTADLESFGPFTPGEREYGDVEGRFVRDDLEAGEHQVKISAQGYAQAEEQVFLAAAGRVEKRFVLAQAGRIRGVVLDRATQRPIVGARIGVASATRDPEPAETAEPAGADGVEERRQKRKARVKAHRAARGEGDPSADPEGDDVRVLGEHVTDEWLGAEATTSARDGSYTLEGVPLGPQR
ncbi:MAG TPA: carboxypeptidase-like regulatory domain-containing protein, partial [Planctomycetota bacterium]|nr:carboxypeptidase-like regulatory domain-containing protein [Planctomycetota bacterium]